MTFFGIVVILFLVYLLIIRPLSRRPRVYRSGNVDDYNNPYVNPAAGSAAAGVATGMILGALLEEGRIDQAQYDYYYSMPSESFMLQDLIDQNILQEHEIEQYQAELAADGQYQYESNDDNSDPGSEHHDSQVDAAPDTGSYDDNSSDNSYDDGGGYDSGDSGGGDDWM